MKTASGRYRVFSLKEEPRKIPKTGMFALSSREAAHDWTFEPTVRVLSPLERRQQETQGPEFVLTIYAITYATEQEAISAAEAWEDEEGHLLQQAEQYEHGLFG